MIETKYIDITNVATMDDLHAAMVAAVQPIVDAETAERQRIVDEYNEYCKPAQEQFDKDTAYQQQQAKLQLKAPKEAMDKAVARIKQRAEEAIDDEVKKYVRVQNRVKAKFDKDTVLPSKVFDNAVAARKAEVEETLKKLGDEVNAKIEPINAEYRALAEELEKKIQEAKDQGLPEFVDTREEEGQSPQE